jgi:16S rRNA (cytosine967-C5)-methyltransferase
VQDPAQALVCRFAGFPPDALVYDACAAPGGKALALARRARVVIAADISRRRLHRVRQNVARAGRGNERLLVADAARPPIRSVKAYLLDAPCLATGSFARHPDARHRIREDAIGPLTAMQSRLLEAAADRIARGGVLCYATCSLEPEENEDRIAAFHERHPDFRREPPGDFPPELLTPAGDLATFPHRDGMDGAFAARLVRLA